MERRYGVIKITDHLVEERPEFVAAVFAKMEAVVLRCENMFAERVLEYMIYSPLLPIGAKYSRAGEFTVLITNRYDEEGNMIDFDVSLEKVKDLTSPLMVIPPEKKDSDFEEKGRILQKYKKLI